MRRRHHPRTLAQKKNAKREKRASNGGWCAEGQVFCCLLLCHGSGLADGGTGNPGGATSEEGGTQNESVVVQSGNLSMKEGKTWET